MKWIKQANGYWLAQGNNGNFLLWKERGMWRGRYLSNDGMKFFRMPARQKISEIKAMCEDNAYWEVAA